MESREELERELAAVERELADLKTPAGRKLSGPAFAKRALLQANTTREEVENLKRWLNYPDNFGAAECNAALRRLIAFVKLPNLSAPPAEISRFRWAFTPAALADAPTGPFEFLALAALLAAESHPNCFGRFDSPDAVDARVKALTARQAELRSRLEALTPS